MKLQTGFSALGALLPIAAVVAIYFGLGAGWSVLGIVSGVVGALMVVSYIVAAVSATSSFGEYMRGWLVGLNSALNTVLGFAIFSSFAGTAGGIIVGIAVGLLNLLCVFAPISRSGFFQGVVGWANWLLPMSWPIVALGFLFYLFSFLLHAVTVGKVAYLKVQDLGADWKTGTLFIKGGLVANLNYLDTAFNMGNFSFVDYKSGDWHKEHEAGHTLNLAAFGFVFHLVGALDENVFRGANAYSERLAESNSSGDGGSNIPMWA
ncbi:MAG: hypothetical protein OEL91_05415 [Burkholderiaceae bacterium]|nr:hypothetical protein [Burkholderiaceae bacterium]